jgi:PAS domain S-box-containing protein
MLNFLQKLFSSSDFMPHGHCYFWRPEIVWLHVISDALIALAYYSIPISLLYLVRKRRDIPFPWLFWLFGAFIVACGTTHVLSIVTIWDPIYRVDGVLKAITAIISVATAIALIPIIPKALGLASPAALMAANALLEQEIAARREAEARLAEANREIEARVQERTAELGETIERLRESDNRLHTVLETAPVILFAADASGVFTFRGGKGLETFGPRPGNWVGKSLIEVYQERPEVLDGFRRAISGEANDLELLIQDRTFDVRFAPTRQQDGTVTGVTGITVDVTASIQARERLRDAMEEAERANNAKNEFLSRMSHELRTPLNAVLGFAQLLEMRTLNADDTTSIRQILKAARHLLALIDEVLDISRIESGKLELTLEPISLIETTQAALKLLAPMAQLRNIRFHGLPQETPDLHVQADKLRFHQSLLNLVANAVKFNKDCGDVTLGIERRDDQVRVLISDTGPGIAAEDLPKLFSPFERLDANERNIDGTGIGLALTKRLIESQGGQVGVESHVGQGSTFWIELPLAENPEGYLQSLPAPAELPDPPREQKPARSTVLYIEDNVSNYTLVESIFKQYPHVRLIAAMQGKLGLEMARRHLPEFILLDLQLPDIKGDEVLRRLQADPATQDIPVIMLSADATKSQTERLLALGVREYLTKPLDVRRFLNVVNGLLTPV